MNNKEYWERKFNENVRKYFTSDMTYEEFHSAQAECLKKIKEFSVTIE